MHVVHSLTTKGYCRISQDILKMAAADLYDILSRGKFLCRAIPIILLVRISLCFFLVSRLGRPGSSLYFLISRAQARLESATRHKADRTHPNWPKPRAHFRRDDRVSFSVLLVVFLFKHIFIISLNCLSIFWTCMESGMHEKNVMESGLSVSFRFSMSKCFTTWHSAICVSLA